LVAPGRSGSDANLQQIHRIGAESVARLLFSCGSADWTPAPLADRGNPVQGTEIDVDEDSIGADWTSAKSLRVPVPIGNIEPSASDQTRRISSILKSAGRLDGRPALCF
jgi:hypothetical protein